MAELYICYFSCCFSWQFIQTFQYFAQTLSGLALCGFQDLADVYCFFCKHKSISLNNLSPSLLSVTGNTVLSLSISFSVISDSCCCSFCCSLAVYLSIPFVPTWWGWNWCCSNTIFILGLQGFLNIFKVSSKIHLCSSCSADSVCWQTSKASSPTVCGEKKTHCLKIFFHLTFRLLSPRWRHWSPLSKDLLSLATQEPLE